MQYAVERDDSRIPPLYIYRTQSPCVLCAVLSDMTMQYTLLSTIGAIMSIYADIM